MLVIGTDFKWLVAGDIDGIHERVELSEDPEQAVDELMNWMTGYLLKSRKHHIFVCFEGNTFWVTNYFLEKLRYSVIATRVHVACEVEMVSGPNRPGVYLKQDLKEQLQDIAAEMKMSPMAQPVDDWATLLMVCGTRLLDTEVYAILVGC
jgi:hypothetical protein